MRSIIAPDHEALRLLEAGLAVYPATRLHWLAQSCLRGVNQIVEASRTQCPVSDISHIFQLHDQCISASIDVSDVIIWLLDLGQTFLSRHPSHAVALALREVLARFCSS